MSRRPRQIVFVCSAIINGNLISEMVERGAADDARDTFSVKHGVAPLTVLGPFYRKKMGVLKAHNEIDLSGKSIKCQYDGWNVTAMVLNYPADTAWVFFNSRVDGKKMPKPQSVILRIEELGCKIE